MRCGHTATCSCTPDFNIWNLIAFVGIKVTLNGYRDTLLCVDVLAQGLLFCDPSDNVNLPEECMFIAFWVDYCNKYYSSMGYALTDRSVGVHFNNSTILVLVLIRST